MYESTGWGEYPDERAALPMGDLQPTMSGLLYVPNLGPVGSGSSYYPGDTTQDARALHFLGYISDQELAVHVGTTGSQRGDMNASAGAWSPTFLEATGSFQEDVGLDADRWIGPRTRAKLLEQVNIKNAHEGPSPLPPPPLPPIPIPPGPFPPGPIPHIEPGPGPSPFPKPPGPQPVAAKKDNTTRNVLIGAGVLGALGLGYFLFKD